MNNQVCIHYEIEGNGPPLVLLHGLGENLNIWRELGYVDRLKKDRKLILIDARGHGLSDKPQGSRFYRLKLMASDVVAVLDEMEIKKTDFMGFSLGGWIGFGVAKYAPERLRSLIIVGMDPYQTEEDDDLPQVICAKELQILLIVGQDDSFYAEARTFADKTPKVKLISYPLMGHFEPLFRTDITLPHITGFLKRIKP
jgi:alpha-beta hydrolase superfamily lysophospholipase